MSMRTSTRATGTAALVISMIALLLALGGTSFAAVALAKNSVGAKQLKTNAVTGAKVKDASLGAADFAPGQLPAGATGAPGAPGAAGAPGLSDYVMVTGPLVSVAPGADDVSTASCVGGRKPVGGGGGSYNGDAVIALSAPTDADGQVLTSQARNSWSVDVQNNSANNRLIFSYAICAKVS